MRIFTKTVQTEAFFDLIFCHSPVLTKQFFPVTTYLFVKPNPLQGKKCPCHFNEVI